MKFRSQEQTKADFIHVQQINWRTVRVTIKDCETCKNHMGNAFSSRSVVDGEAWKIF